MKNLASMEMKKSPRVKWLVEKVKGERILDIGFLGSYSKPLLHNLIRECNRKELVVGLDMNIEGVHIHQMPDSLVADGFNLPFKENSFNSVILAEVIEHFWDSTRLVGEVSRILKPEGKLYLTTPNPHAINRLFGNWLAVKNPATRRNYKNFLGDQDHKLFYDPLSLCNYLENFGFDIIELTTKNFTLPIVGIDFDLSFPPFNRLSGFTCIIAQRSKQ